MGTLLLGAAGLVTLLLLSMAPIDVSWLRGAKCFRIETLAVGLPRMIGHGFFALERQEVADEEGRVDLSVLTS